MKVQTLVCEQFAASRADESRQLAGIRPSKDTGYRIAVRRVHPGYD
jgi:hypothetical protein